MYRPEPRDKLDASVNGPAGPSPVLDGAAWEQVDWRVHEERVRRLRGRIFKAAKEGDLATVRDLQKLTAPRGALSYPRFSREELEGRFLGLMAYLDRKRFRGTAACQENSDRVQAYEARRCGTRATRLKLDCLYHNLQKVQLHARRKDARNRRRILHRHNQLVGATFGMRSDAQRGYSRR